ncbi:MAG: FG-GAP-like repeat-containing protein [Desulfobulbaceae bacterium]|nr:FG-GAP-like repeat-containing protein [Desulfobulbaceae bacterium]
MRRVVIYLFAFFLGLFPDICLAVDKSGVSPETISLPSGPGSIEGLGPSFQPMLNTGSSRYTVQVAMPAGVAGNTPGLSLQYDSGKGDGPLGIGWSFGPGGIARQTDKGIPRYVDAANSVDDDHDGQVDEPDELDTFVGPDGEELVHIGSDTFRARIEGAFVRYRKVGEYWEADLKGGTTLQFGITGDARETDASGQKTFRWLLQKSIDPNGNVVEYIYGELPLSENVKYLREIRYGPGAPPWSTFYFARFLYEPKPDWRKDYRSGFLLKTAHRLQRIDIGIQGATPEQCLQGDWNEDSTGDSLVRRYVLAYTDSGSVSSQLTTITRFGADGINSLPPLTFSYSSSGPVLQNIPAEQVLITSVNAPFTVMDSNLVDLVDLNRDGLADILKTDFGGGSHTVYENQGVSTQGNSQVITWSDGQNVGAEDGLALQLYLAEDVVHLADMDGNGLADLIRTTVGGEVNYYVNNGNFSWSSRKQMSVQDTSPPAPYSSEDITIADLDFDKRIDVVKSTAAGYSIWFNIDEGKYSYEVHTGGASHQDQVVQFSGSGVQTADINGDRLIDVTRVTPTSIIYNASMGHGMFADAAEIFIPDYILTDGENGQVSRAKLTDINGDGLADLVIERAAVNELWFWLNLGTDALSARYRLTGMPSQFGPDTSVRWADINGNGTTDLIYADSTAAERLRAIDIGQLVGGSAHPHLLTGIENGLGVRTAIEYRSSTDFYLQASEIGNPWQTTIPFPLQVVARVTTTTELDLDGIPGSDQYVKEYVYRDGYYEDREKQFRGFARVKVIEQGDASAPTGITVHEFYTGGPDDADNDGDGAVDEIGEENHREEDALKGMVRAVQKEAEDGSIFNRVANSWMVRTLLTGVAGTEIRFAHQTQTDTLVYEKTASPETMRTTFLYDDFGNIREERNEGALSIAGDEKYQFTEYINNETDWLLGLPQHSYVTDADATKAAETFTYYDGAVFVGLPLGQATMGNVTRQEQWVSGATFIDSLRRQYDSFGNITAVLDPNGNRRSITWDQDLYAYPVREDIEVGAPSADLSISATYNLGLGTVTGSRDFNGNQTDYGYDVFGRLTSVVLPGDSASLPTMMFAYAMADPLNGLLYSYDASGTLDLTAGAPIASSVATRSREVSGQVGTFDSIHYLDGLGRSLATISEGEQNFIVAGAKLFNSRGSERYSFLPYTATDIGYAVPAMSNVYTEKKYDAAGREIETVNPPDDNAAITSVITQHLPLAQTIVDENNNAKNYFYDGLGRLLRVQENNGGEPYITSYSYNTLGSLTEIIDSQNNIKTMSYDGLGRKISMDDPDKGHMEYQFDNAGNLIGTLDNKGQVTNYAYDGANRLLTIDYLDSAGITPDVLFHYDTSSTDYPYVANLKGRLAWLEDLSGSSFYSYDSRGNSDWQVTRLNDGGTVTDFMSRAEYDAMGRVTATTFPDGDRVTYTYNNGSLLEAIPGIVTNIDYTATGLRSGISLRNSLSTEYGYDPRQRLNRLATSDTLAGGLLQDFSYSFDGVGNITEIADNRALPAGSPKNGSQTFVFDDLYRLTSAEGMGYGVINYQYDRIGNMISKASPDAPDPGHIDDPLINLGAMSYGGTAGASNRGPGLTGGHPGPHALTASASGLAYDYDNNGNMISRGLGDIYEWDFADRLIKATTADSESTFVYDASGQRRIKKTVENGITTTDYYISGNYEIRNGLPVKYVFDGARRVARLEGRLTSGGESAGQVLRLSAGWNFFGLTVEPGDPATASVLATINGRYSELWGFDPAIQNYLGHVPAEGISDLAEMHGGRGYLIKMNSPALLYIPGTRITAAMELQIGWNLVPCPVNAESPVADALNGIEGQYDSVWEYDAETGNWLVYRPLSPPFINTLETMSPGKAYWIRMKESAQLDFLQQPRKIHFYHTDHLGSASLVTDVNGIVVEETHFYPFGRPRYEERNGFDSAYKFTGKELDQATGLMYYQARYYDPVASRFISVDPLYTGAISADKAQSGNFLTNPQAGNLYSYTRNNPVVRIDPSGLDDITAGSDVTLEEVFTNRLREERATVLETIKTSAEQQQSLTLERGALSKQIADNKMQLIEEMQYYQEVYGKRRNQLDRDDAVTEHYAAGSDLGGKIETVKLAYQLATDPSSVGSEYKKMERLNNAYVLQHDDVRGALNAVEARMEKIAALQAKHAIAVEKWEKANSTRVSSYNRLDSINEDIRTQRKLAGEIQKEYEEQSKNPTGARLIVY